MSILNKIFGQKFKVNNNISSQSQTLPDFDKFHEFGQIISIFDFVLNPDDSIAMKSAETIHRLFIQATDFKNKQLYQTFRYLSLTKSDIDKFERFPIEIKTTLLCIASLNSNGYSREKALDKLVEIKGQRIFPFIIFRLADWVLPIRIKAEKIIEDYVTEENSIILIKNHKLINWLLNIERNNLSELYQRIIFTVANKQLSVSELKQLKEGERFFYYKSFIESHILDLNVVESILNDKYYLIRQLIIKHLDKLSNKNKVLSKLLNDKSQKNRQSAVNWITAQNAEEFKSILETLIYDNSSSIRFESRRLLSNIGDWEFCQLYKEKINNSDFSIGSILGLSEVGNKQDVPLIADFLTSSKAKLKTAALIGLYNLDKELATEKAYEIIEFENPVSTKKAAELILSKQGVDLSRLRTIYEKTDFSGKRVILSLINRFSGWSAAGDYLKAIIEQDNKLTQIANYYLIAWDRYTMKLGTKQTKEDKEYVLFWYNKAKVIGLQVPENIPFIFRDE